MASSSTRRLLNTGDLPANASPASLHHRWQSAPPAPDGATLQPPRGFLGPVGVEGVQRQGDSTSCSRQETRSEAAQTTTTADSTRSNATLYIAFDHKRRRPEHTLGLGRN